MLKTFPRRRLALAVCLSSLALPAVAGAATPGTVSIRVEGATATLVPQTAVTTTTAPADKAGQACSGTSAGGALQTAAGGDWSGPFTYAQTVERIKGEEHTFSSGTYWAVFLNGHLSDNGICETELQPGDSVLIYAACAGASSGCASGELDAKVPATAAPGAPLTVTVTESTTTFGPAPDYAKIETKDPAPGVTVSGSAGSAQTGADGKATLTPTQRGPLDLLVTKPDRVRQTISTCVTDGADGFCGTTKPGDPPAPVGANCQTSGSDGLCGSPDRTAPAAAITGLKEQASFPRGSAPTTLAGKVATDPAGLKDVRLRLTRTLGPRCSFYDGARERFVKTRRCGVKGGRFFSIGDRADWSYLLPFDLPRGRYVLDVQVVDKAGNVSRISARGRDRIVFTVK